MSTRRINGTIIGVLAVLLIGCVGPDGKPPTVEQIVTPARIEAVTAFGTYMAGKAAINDGASAEIERALLGLQAMKEAGKSDLAAVAAALQAAGIKQLETVEGQLAFALVVSFQDLWSSGPQQVLDSAYGMAIRDGAIRGLSLSLSTRRSYREADATLELLADEAKASRPRR